MTPFNVISPAPRALWRELLDENTDAFPTQTPEWMDAMSACARYTDCSRAYEFPRGRYLVLVLARRNRCLGRFAPDGSWPIDWGIGGVLSSDGRLCAEELRSVFHDLSHRPG